MSESGSDARHTRLLFPVRETSGDDLSNNEIASTRRVLPTVHNSFPITVDVCRTLQTTPPLPARLQTAHACYSGDQTRRATYR